MLLHPRWCWCSNRPRISPRRKRSEDLYQRVPWVRLSSRGTCRRFVGYRPPVKQMTINQNDPCVFFGSWLIIYLQHGVRIAGSASDVDEQVFVILLFSNERRKAKWVKRRKQKQEPRQGELIEFRECAQITVSGSRCCSRKAENSTSRNLWVAMARPSHGGGGAGGVRPAAVATVVADADEEDEGALLLGVADGAKRAISPPPPLPAEPVPPFDVPFPDLLLVDGLAPTA